MNKKEWDKRLAKLDTAGGVSTLLREMAKLNRAGRDVILRSLSEQMSEGKKQQFLALIRSEAVKADEKVREWVAKGISNTYVAGMNQANELYKIAVPNTKDAVHISVDMLKTQVVLAPHLQAVNALISDTYLDFGNAITGFVRGSEKILNDTLKRQLRATIAEGRLEGDSIRDVSKAVKEVFSEKGFTVLLDKAGKQWELERYSEMLARTHILRANNEGVINRAGDFGVDTVQVLTNLDACEYCDGFADKIYSVSGKSKEYDALAGNEPPFHPHCRCTLLLRPDLDERNQE